MDASAISLIRDAVCKGRIHTDTNYMDVISGNYRHESPRLYMLHLHHRRKFIDAKRSIMW